MKKYFIVILLLIILLLVIYLKRINNNIEKFEEKLDYSVNSRLGGKKAFIYNISKITELPNNIGKALKFNGSDSYLYVPNINFPKYSISFLAKFSELNYDFFVLSPADEGESKTWQLMIQGGKLILKLFSLNDVKILESSKLLNVNEWYHISLISDNEKYILFVNGTQNKLEYKSSDKLSNLIFGTDKEKKVFFNGFIGDINIADEIYDKEELCNIYNLCGGSKSILIQDSANVSSQSADTETYADNSKQEPDVCFTPPKLEKKCEFLAHGDSKVECLKKCVNDSGCLPTECKKICDQCDDEKICKWIKVQVPKCKFVPYGSSLFNCINKCTLENGCDYLKCQNICRGCMDHDSCPWIESVEVKKEPEVVEPPIQPPPKFDEKGTPMPPKIRMTVLDGKVKLNWFRPSPGADPIESYMSFLYKTMNKSEGIKITMVPFPTCEDCVHILDGLDKDTLYSVGIRAYNKNGMSDMSNIVTFKPQKNMKPKEFKLPEPKPISEIETKYSFKYCNYK